VTLKLRSTLSQVGGQSVVLDDSIRRSPDTGWRHDKCVDVLGAFTAAKRENHGRAADHANLPSHSSLLKLLVQKKEHLFQFLFGELEWLNFHDPFGIVRFGSPCLLGSFARCCYIVEVFWRLSRWGTRLGIRVERNTQSRLTPSISL